jgi:hypothetical protein
MLWRKETVFCLSLKDKRRAEKQMEAAMRTTLAALTIFLALGIAFAQNLPVAPSQDNAETQFRGIRCLM